MALDNTSSPERQAAFMSALITEHFVLQTAARATVTEAASRTSLYVFSLSSSLVAMGFVSQFQQTFHLFAATILPALLVLGVFTTVRLVDTGIENQQFLRGIARIRGYYRTLTPDAALHFSSESWRWPEAHAAPPLWYGARTALLTTAGELVTHTGEAFLFYKKPLKPIAEQACHDGAAVLLEVKRSASGNTYGPSRSPEPA
jgi:hypothetical protein